MSTRRRGAGHPKLSRGRPNRPHRFTRHRRPYQRGYVGPQHQYAIRASLPPSQRHGLIMSRLPSKKEREFDLMQERGRQEATRRRERNEALRGFVFSEPPAPSAPARSSRSRSVPAPANDETRQVIALQQKIDREARAAKRGHTSVTLNEIQKQMRQKRGTMAMKSMAKALNEAVDAHRYNDVLAMLSGMKLEAAAPAWTPIRDPNADDE